MLKAAVSEEASALISVPSSDAENLCVVLSARGFNAKLKFMERGLDERGIRKDLGIIIVAIKRAAVDMEFNPTSSSVIKHGNTLIALGEIKQLEALKLLVGVSAYRMFF